MGKKNNNQKGKFHPAKTPESRRRQHFAIEAKKKQSLQRGKGQTPRNSTQQSVSTEHTYGNHVFVNYYPHFRRLKKGGHPALIVYLTEHKDTGGKIYGYRSTTHGEYGVDHRQYIGQSIVRDSHGRSYDVIYPNPDPEDDMPMLILRRTRTAVPTAFSDHPLSWKCPSVTADDSECK